MHRKIYFRREMSPGDASNFLFFVNTVKFNDADLRVASILAESKLRKGSRIDVWADDTFWAARITNVSANGFGFRYCGNKAFGGGVVERKHFQKTWRFPVESRHQVVLAEALAKVMDE